MQASAWASGTESIVMTTESSCVSTIGRRTVRSKTGFPYIKRENEYREIRPSRLAYYDYLLEGGSRRGEADDCSSLPSEQCLYNRRGE